jgi:hypothetical protein
MIWDTAVGFLSTNAVSSFSVSTDDSLVILPIGFTVISVEALAEAPKASEAVDMQVTLKPNEDIP